MHNLISLYNQNRKKIWISILTIFLIGMILWRIIYLLDGNSRNVGLTNDKSQINTSELNSVSISSEKSAITGRNITIQQDGIKAIDNFISYCNSGNIPEAYNLISNECKQEMYPEFTKFQNNYYNPIFNNGKRNVIIENWVGDIYRIELNEDALATGRYSNQNSLQDYITIVKDSENNYKLNINGYIGKKEYNKTMTAEQIEMKLLKSDSYMDYEIYTFEIKNNFDYSISLGDIEDSDNVSYLIDKNDLKYNAYVHELSKSDLTILPKQTKTLRIKYFNEYSSTGKMEKLVFPKISISDYISHYTSINFNL